MRQRVWKRSLARCGCLLAALWVAGGAAAAARSITFVHYFGPEQMAGLQPLIDRFEREQGATVEVVAVTSGEVVEKLQVMGAAGVFPDVVRLGSEFINLVGTGVFADLAPYIRRDGVSLDAFYPATLAAFRIGGRQLALPTAISTFAYFYDADRFAEGGLTPPSHDWADTAWDWDAFIAAARKLTSRAAPQRWAIQGFGDPWMWPWWWGGDWLDAASREALADTP
ncbi:MAG TPA: extracellular solute-binding protein, partial [Limnochordia bacterium]